MKSTANSGLQLSKVRTFLLWAFAIVWFSEMMLWAVRPLAEPWTRFWQQLPPADPQLTSALYITHSLEATVKGALGVLAVFALRSRSPFVRSALFVPMALVPPLNLAFQFRAQGFPLGPTTVGAVLSIILWGSYLLFTDPTDSVLRGPNPSEQSAPSRWGSCQYLWLGANAAILTIAASVFLFTPEIGLRLVFPCLSGLLDSARGVPPGLTHSLMAVGTHVLALAIAGWIGAAYARRNSTVRRAVTVASAIQVALLCTLPLRQIALDFGWSCAAASLLIYGIPLCVAWVSYAAVSYRASLSKSLHRAFR